MGHTIYDPNGLKGQQQESTPALLLSPDDSSRAGADQYGLCNA